MYLQVNGQAQEYAEPLTVASLLTILALKGRVAVEINGEIVPRGQFATHTLRDGDVLEIVRAIGGG